MQRLFVRNVSCPLPPSLLRELKMEIWLNDLQQGAASRSSHSSVQGLRVLIDACNPMACLVRTSTFMIGYVVKTSQVVNFWFESMVRQ